MGFAAGNEGKHERDRGGDFGVCAMEKNHVLTDTSTRESTTSDAQEKTRQGLESDATYPRWSPYRTAAEWRVCVEGLAAPPWLLPEKTREH
jgi:hypothetical protein